MILQNIFSVVFFLYLGLTAHVRSQTCESIYPSSPCSNNAACGCIPLAIADDIGICGLSAINCARLSSCDADYSCPSANQMCVSHSRCGPTPICYPMSMTDPRLCPPMTTTTSSPFYTTQGNGTFETTTNGFDDNATVFYTTQGNETFETTTNGFNDNATEFYTTQGNETFETTTNGFNDNATSSYPTDWIRSTYSGDLTMYSRLDPNTNKYYELYRIRVNISGQYQIRSISNMDTYGCIYYESPSTIISTNTSNPSNAMSCNDDNNGNQFQLNVYLYADTAYTLLFTTFSSNVTGLYAIEVYGADVNEFYPIYLEFETTTTFSMNSTESENATTSQSAIVSIYSSVLTENSPKMLGFQRHYEAIEISVNISGFYTIRSEETLDGMGYLYRYYFSPSNERENLLVYDDQSGGNNQFSMSVYLEAGSPYVLVFTTYGANIVGSFSIIVSGAGRVELTHSSSIESTGTAAPFEFTTNSMNETESYTNNSSIIVSEYSSALTIDSSNFSRPSGSGGGFYYEAIEIKTETLGFYTIVSQQQSNTFFADTTAAFSFGNESSTSVEVMDTVGYLYEDSFSPSSTSMNLRVADDDGAGNRQFRLMYTLEPGKRYIIVFTTFSQSTIGAFSIKATGPDHVTFARINDI